MSNQTNDRMLVFPKWTNYLLPCMGVLAIGAGSYMPVLLGLGGSPSTTNIGYAPAQPLPFSHAVHAGKLGMDCRYCHSTVDKAAFAAIPPTQTCLNCHTHIKPDSQAILKIRQSALTGKPIRWVKVHSLPDYAYFNHSAHVNRGVGCVSCHGRVDQMEVVEQVSELSMKWCLDCHRAPQQRRRRQPLPGFWWEKS